MKNDVWNCDMGGPYVPLVMVLVVAVPFFCMLHFSESKLAEVTAERDALKAELDGFQSEVARIDARIGVLRKQMHENELKLHGEYVDMGQAPPVWPKDSINPNNPSVFVSKRRRKQYVNYLAARPKERYTRYPCDVGTYAGPSSYGWPSSSLSLRRDRADTDRVGQ